MNQENIYSAYHIANNKVEYSPQRKNNFMLVIPGLQRVLRMGAQLESTNANDFVNGQEELKLALKACTVPEMSQDQIIIHRGNSQIKFPGKPSFSDISITAYDYIGANVKDALYGWQNLCYNTTYDFIGSGKSYKMDCTLYEYTPDGNQVRYWIIKGAWPRNVKPDDFDMSDGGEATVSASLSIDWAEMHLPDEA